jgi:hypothetical protein
MRTGGRFRKTKWNGDGFSRPAPEENTMGEKSKQKKEPKKEPQKTIKEKRKEKEEKRAAKGE